MIMSLLAGKTGIVFGVANKRSIAWAIAQAWAEEGAKLAFTYQGERVKENVEELAGTFGADTLIMPCDVTKDEDIASVFNERRREIWQAESAAALRGVCAEGRAGRTFRGHHPRGLPASRTMSARIRSSRWPARPRR